MLKIRTMEKRFVLFLLLPVTLLLVGMGVAGFIYARTTILSQWEEAALLRLQRAAHFVDMRLSRPKELIRLYLETEPGHMSTSIRQAILNQLRRTAGVVKINRSVHNVSGQIINDLYASNQVRSHNGMIQASHKGVGRHPTGNENLTITLPRFGADVPNKTVSLIADVLDDQGNRLEALEVVMEFGFLIEDLSHLGWWETRRSFLVDADGRVLVGNAPTSRTILGDTGIQLEIQTLMTLKTDQSGTIRGSGHPPDEISGFHRLMEAPWYIVVFSPGKEILKPISRFRNVYFFTLSLSMLTILFLIRRAVNRTTHSIKNISIAADEIAGGRFSDPLPINSHDEIGELIRSFNTMSSQLKERIQLKHSLILAKEVQQNLIPSKDPELLGLDVAGRSEFCDETGGDYYDFIFDETDQPGPIRMVIGDVAGHGIASALLMSGVRASFRQRNSVKGSIAEVIGDVNHQVVKDVGDSGQFMTLFCLEVDRNRRSARWVRAGHEPGLLYRAESDKFEWLKGKGVPLGVSEKVYFHEYTINHLRPGDVILLGTDGIWEAMNPNNKMFGKQRFKRLVRHQRHESAKQIISTVFEEIKQFTEYQTLHDDITLVVAKL